MATYPISESKWGQNLLDRKRDFKYFFIPRDYVRRWHFTDGTRRHFRITLSDGTSLIGYLRITSGMELSIPRRYEEYLRTNDWFECEVLDYENYPGEPLLELE